VDWNRTRFAIVFSHRCCEIVAPKLASDTGHRREGVQVATYESFEALAMGELNIELAAVADTPAASTPYSPA
jgi:hypothetical protein